jgi:tetratricopeptide (TPR) repeat protein
MRKWLIISALIGACGGAAFYYRSAESPREARDRYLVAGYDYVKDGKMPEAVIMFKNAVQVDPNSAEARYELGLAHMRRRDLSQAFAELRRAVELKPALLNARHQLGLLYIIDRNIAGAREQLTAIRTHDSAAFEARYLGAAVALAEQDLDGALKEMGQAVHRAEDEKSPNLADVYIELGNIHLLKKNWDQAENSYRRAIGIDRKLLRAREGLASVYMLKGHDDKARDELILATRIDPTNEDALHLLGNFYARTNRIEEYEQFYRDLTQAKPKSSTGKKRMAEILFTKGDVVSAQKYLDEILKAEPRDKHALLLRGRIYLIEKDFRRAYDTFTRITAEDLRLAPAFYFLGAAQLGLGDVAQARGSLLKALELSPEAIEPRVMLAEIYLGSGDIESARGDIDLVLKYAPQNRSALLISAAAYLAKGEADKSLAVLRKAQSLDPEDARTYLLSGAASLLQKNYAQAVKEFEACLSRDPNVLEALNSIALTMVRQGNRKGAMERVERHFPKTKLQAEVLQLLGQLSLDAKEFDAGIDYLRRAIGLKPDLMPAYFLIGSAYIAQNKTDEAVREYENVIKRNPRNAAAHTILGVLKDQKQQYGKANEHYEMALKINPDFVPAANNLAWNYAVHSGNLDLALPLAQKARELSPGNPQILDTLGWIYYKKGLFDNAVTLLKDSSEKLQNAEPIVLYHLGAAYQKGGRRSEAREALTKALALNKDFPGADEARRFLADSGTR